jgi:hypothetical protein
MNINTQKGKLSISNNILNKILIIDKVYILDANNSLYDKIELQKRQNNSFYTKILKINKSDN